MLYPHSATAVLAAGGRNVVKRNMAMLPAYSLMLGFLSLLGFMAIAAGTKPVNNDSNTIVPALLNQQFPPWFAGVSFAAIGIGALVPAAIMSIAAANTFTRNIYKEYFKPDATARQETIVAKIVSLVVKFGALAFVLFLNPSFSIDLQLIGGVIIIQTLPAVGIGLFTRWFHRGGLIAGWVVGMVVLRLHAVADPEPEDQPRALRRECVSVVPLRVRHQRDHLGRHHRAAREPDRRGRRHRGAPGDEASGG